MWLLTCSPTCIAKFCIFLAWSWSFLLLAVSNLSVKLSHYRYILLSFFPPKPIFKSPLFNCVNNLYSSYILLSFHSSTVDCDYSFFSSAFWSCSLGLCSVLMVLYIVVCCIITSILCNFFMCRTAYLGGNCAFCCTFCLPLLFVFIVVLAHFKMFRFCVFSVHFVFSLFIMHAFLFLCHVIYVHVYLFILCIFCFVLVDLVIIILANFKLHYLIKLVYWVYVLVTFELFCWD